MDNWCQMKSLSIFSCLVYMAESTDKNDKNLPAAAGRITALIGNVSNS